MKMFLLSCLYFDKSSICENRIKDMDKGKQNIQGQTVVFLTYFQVKITCFLKDCLDFK